MTFPVMTDFELLPEDVSLEQRVAALPREEQDAILAGLDLAGLEWDWGWTARPSQHLDVADDTWAVTVLMGGRGSGKTRSVLEWVRELDQAWPRLGRDRGRLRGALLARTAADVRDTMLHGPSGLLHIWPPSQADLVQWIPTRRRLVLPGGSVWTTFSAAEPDQLRGPAQHASAVDELAAHNAKPGIDGLTAWDNIRIGTRMGSSPQVAAATTPKRTALMRRLLAEAALPQNRIRVRRMRTLDNVHLAQTYLDTVLALFEGTTVGAQELDGMMLDEVDGALLAQSVLDLYRVSALPPGGPFGPGWLRVVGVDPSVADRPRDECGIVVVATPGGLPVLSRTAYVLDDRSARMDPGQWGRAVVQAARDWRAEVVAEVNQGGSLVRRVIAEEAARLGVPPPRVREVRARVGKALRAEPVVAAYQRGRIHHLLTHPELESQLTSWLPGEAGYSPDRIDAAVYALAALVLPESVRGGLAGTAAIRNPAAYVIDAPPPTAKRTAPASVRIAATSRRSPAPPFFTQPSR